MKRSVYLICIIVIIFFLYSCNIKGVDTASVDITEKSEVIHYIENDTIDNAALDVVIESSEKINYSNENDRILIKEFTRYKSIYYSEKYRILSNFYLDFDHSIEKEVFIEYPKILLHENRENEDGINKIFKEIALNDYENYWINEGLLLDRAYKITYADNKLISVTFESEPYVKGANHPSTECFAVTVNLETAEPCSFADFISSYELLEQKILDGKYELLHGFISERYSDDLIFIKEHYENISIENHVNDFYLSNDGTICIIIETVQAHGGFLVINLF